VGQKKKGGIEQSWEKSPWRKGRDALDTYGEGHRGGYLPLGEIEHAQEQRCLEKTAHKSSPRRGSYEERTIR